MDIPFTLFPSVYQHHSSLHTHRDYFLDYGSHMNMDIEAHQLLTEGRLKTICQKCHPGQEQNLHLSAIFPTLPLAPHPAAVTFPFPDGIGDPVRDCQEKTHFFIAKIRHNQGRLRLNSMSRFHQNIIQVGRTVSMLGQADWPPVDKICSSVPRLAVMWRDYQHLIKYNKYLRVNSAYTGGCLCLLSLSDSTYMLHPSGELFNRINVTEVLNAGYQGFKLENTVLYEEQTSSSVLEMRTSYVNNIGLCCMRGDTDYSVYRVAEAGTILEPILLENRHMFGETPTSVCLSPYICGEILVSTDTGSVHLSVPGYSLQTLVSKQLLRFQSTDQWRQCHWGAHPRQVILADRTSVQLFDSRTQYSEGLDLLAQPTKLLHQQERIMVTQPHPHCPYYHFIATDFSLLMMDQRLPNYPVMVWPHTLPSAPQYLAVANTTSSDSLVLTASQSPPETHCFHVKYGDTKPVRSQYQPWRLSTISAVMTRECKRSLMGQVIQRRLDTSLAGVAVSHTGNNVHMYQLTSHGEVFYQVYSNTGNSSEKTCRSTLSTHEVSAVVKEVTRKWLAGLQDQLDSVTTPEEQYYTSDVSHYLRKVAAVIPHVLCPLCMPATCSLVCYSVSMDSNSTKKGSTCSSCGHDLDTAHSILQHSGMSDLLREDNVKEDVFNASVPQLEQMPQASSNTQLLLKMWQGQEGIDECVQRREQERQALEKKQREMRAAIQISLRTKKMETSLVDQILSTNQPKIRSEENDGLDDLYGLSEMASEIETESSENLDIETSMENVKISQVGTHIGESRLKGQPVFGREGHLGPHGQTPLMSTLPQTGTSPQSVNDRSSSSQLSHVTSLPGFSCTPSRFCPAAQDTGQSTPTATTHVTCNIDDNDYGDNDDDEFFSQEIQQSLVMFSPSTSSSHLASVRQTNPHAPRPVHDSNKVLSRAREDSDSPTPTKKKKNVPGF
ncbi:uncharacterized protein [Haliotis cracherodii]|uniref:uncharacterized protein n=1 Tax=Haliotis cracherodii TaxID=6455 RepID=UPI0039E944D0